MASREEIWNVIHKHLVDTVENLDGQEIDTSKSIMDLGANSLDIVEIVSCSIRELKIKVPRNELNNLKNIDELIDLLHKVSNASG
ncbi:MAG: acyl carrier protein [Nitrospinae bacterium CG11_big_fil_rev_8_21_14_0_20_56_8]|nr:MAG: acyl carrier protein [Nitrospinae bacterium CG11_big_fil_rev_8_21_14_0_20_56_8]